MSHQYNQNSISAFVSKPGKGKKSEVTHGSMGHKLLI